MMRRVAKLSLLSVLGLMGLVSLPSLSYAYLSPFWDKNRCVDDDDTLRNGDRLYRGQHVCSGSYVFGVDHNGYLGVWFDTSRITDQLWSANTYEQASYLKMH